MCARAYVCVFVSVCVSEVSDVSVSVVRVGQSAQYSAFLGSLQCQFCELGDRVHV